LSIRAQTAPAESATFQAGHPRLFFKKSDLPEIRRRAATPEGKIIVAKLHELLAKPFEIEQSQTTNSRLAGLWAAGHAF